MQSAIVIKTQPNIFVLQGISVKITEMKIDVNEVGEAISLKALLEQPLLILTYFKVERLSDFSAPVP